jgi:flagellar motor switch protein FliG
MAIKNIEKVAVLLMSLEPQRAREIFYHLDPDEINLVSLAMTRLGVVDSDIVEKVILEFLHDLNQSLNVVGNSKTTEKFLKKVLDDDKYQRVIEKIKDSNTNTVWEMIAELDDTVVAQFIKKEYPQTGALILAKIPSFKAAKILKLLSKEYASEVFMRMMYLDPVKSDTLQNIEKVLEAELVDRSKSFKVDDNSKVVIDIFNNFNKEEEQDFIQLIKDRDPLFAQKVSKALITMEDLIFIKDDGIQTLLKNLDNNTMTIALSGATKTIQRFFLDNMSPRIARIVEDEISNGSNKGSRQDIVDAQMKIIKKVKELVNDGVITLAKDYN